MHVYVKFQISRYNGSAPIMVPTSSSWTGIRPPRFPCLFAAAHFGVQILGRVVAHQDSHGFLQQTKKKKTNAFELFRNISPMYMDFE